VVPLSSAGRPARSAAVPVPHALSPTPCASGPTTSQPMQVDYASSTVTSVRSAVVGSNVHGSLFAVSRARRIEYTVVRSADGHLCAMHGRSRVGAGRLGACAGQRGMESAPLIVAIGALRTPTGTLCIVLDAPGATAMRPHRRVKSTRRRCNSPRQTASPTAVETPATRAHILYSPRTANRTLLNFTAAITCNSPLPNDAGMTRRDYQYARQRAARPDKSEGEVGSRDSWRRRWHRRHASSFIADGGGNEKSGNNPHHATSMVDFTESSRVLRWRAVRPW
jgi:hypothetical protein